MFSQLRPNPTDYRNPADDEDDQWGWVGNEARPDQPREVDPDPWYRMNFMSPKARSIERNLGFE